MSSAVNYLINSKMMLVLCQKRLNRSVAGQIELGLKLEDLLKKILI